MTEKTLVGSRDGFSPKAVEELSRLKAEPAWLAERRREAWAAFAQLPMPSLQDEDWRRTDLSGLDMGAFLPFAPNAFRARSVQELPPPVPSALRGEEWAGLLVQQGAEAIYWELSQELSRQGVLFLPLEEAARRAPDLLKGFLGSCIRPEEGKFVALNGALGSGGAFVYVPRGVEAALPLHSILLYPSRPGQGSHAVGWPLPLPSHEGLALFPHTVIVLERDSRLVYIDEYLSPARKGSVLHSGVVEVRLEEGARLQHITLQQWGSQVFNFVTQRALVGAGATLESLVVATGGGLTKAFLDTVLQGPGARARMEGIILGDEGQHFDHQLFIDHAASHTQSRTFYKVGLMDQALSVFLGLVRIQKGARQTDSHLENRNLLLSDRAKADSIPKLEIESSDIIRCSHASSVGQVEEEQLFYLMSRGLSRRQAEKIILDGFFEPVLKGIPVPAVQRRLARLLDRKLARPGRAIRPGWAG